MKNIIAVSAAGLLLALSASPALAVKGEWHTDAESALAAARAARQPVLAVAMDHG